MKTMKVLAAVVLSAICCGLSAQEKEKIYRPADFSKVDVSTKIKARLVASSENKVVVQGDKVDQIVVKEEKGKLSVRFKSTKGIGQEMYPVTIYYRSSPVSLNASGDSEITAEQVIKGSTVRIDASKGAFVRAAVSADTLKASIAAGGQIQVNGDGKLVDVGIKTGGQFNGYEFVADDAEANVTAGGTVYIYATENIKARVGMGGKVYCKGGAKMDGRTTMGGTIITVDD